MMSHLANKCSLDSSHLINSPSHRKWSELSSEKEMEARTHKFGTEEKPTETYYHFYGLLPHS